MTALSFLIIILVGLFFLWAFHRAEAAERQRWVEEERELDLDTKEEISKPFDWERD